MAKSNVCCKSWIIIRKQIGLVADHSFHQCIICFALRFVVFIMIVKYVCTLICFIKIAADNAFYSLHIYCMFIEFTMCSCFLLPVICPFRRPIEISRTEVEGNILLAPNSKGRNIAQHEIEGNIIIPRG